MDLTVRPAGPADAATWDAFLDGHPGVPPLGRHAWKGVLERSYGVPTRFWVAERGGETAGVLPAYVSRSLRGRRTLHGLRYGLVADGPDAVTALLREARRTSQAEGLDAGTVALGAGEAGPDFPRFSRKTMVMPVPADEAAAWAALGNKTRNLLRKATRDGIQVVAGREHLPAFYAVYAEAMARKGVGIHHRGFFDDVLETFGNEATLLAARRGGRVVGGLVLLTSEESAIYPYQATSPEGRAHAATQALVWAALRACAARGIPELDLGESTEGGDVAAFKEHFGGTPRDLAYCTVHGAPPRDAAPPARAQSGPVTRAMPGWMLRPWRRIQRAHGRIV